MRSRRNLAEFEGHYEYRDGATLFMVASGERLVAIIGEAKYALRAAGTDTFTNPSGQPIPFLRDANGRIMAFKESDDTFARLSSSVPAATRRLLEPRPLGPDGLPVVYRYEPPARLPDGIRTGDAGPDTLPPQVAERLVNGVIDGTYPDVRSILVYRKGALLLEEYFYGYDRNRPHQMRSLTKSVISLLAGAAVDRGLLRADEPVLARLGYSAYKNPDPRKAKVTLIDLLSNQSGFACNDRDSDSPGNEVKLYETPDWAKAFVDLPMVADPGTVGRYCSGGFFTTGRIIERVAGKPLPEFAQEVLFEPLGIRPADWKWTLHARSQPAQRVRADLSQAARHAQARDPHPATRRVGGPSRRVRLMDRCGRRAPVAHRRQRLRSGNLAPLVPRADSGGRPPRRHHHAFGKWWAEGVSRAIARSDRGVHGSRLQRGIARERDDGAGPAAGADWKPNRPVSARRPAVDAGPPTI